jgi:hypothetical protein
VVDPETAETVRRLMQDDDVSGGEFPTDPDDLARAACCPATDEPCRSCAADHPAEMADDFRTAHHRAMVRELAKAREMSGLEFAPEPVADDVAFDPSPEDLSWYHEHCREYEEKIWRERIEADVPADDEDAELLARWEAWRAKLGVGDLRPAATFVDKLTRLAHDFLDDPDDDLAWIGRQIWSLKERAEFLGATSGESFDERHDCYLDAEIARIGATRF